MQKYGLIGYPLKHSFSIGYFNEKFQSENIDAEYVNFEIPRIEDFMEVIEENPDLCGLNVTIPYKEKVISYLDELDKDTAKIGAVNVIKILRQPKGKVKLVGYNSDIIGFTRSIEPLLQPHHTKALILGTGGASKVESAKVRAVQSSRAKEIRSASPAWRTFSRPTFIIPSEMSAPINDWGCSSRQARMAKSPVPVAISSICCGW